jgi:hypothetical protein
MEGKIRRRMEKKGLVLSGIFFLLIQTTGLVVDEFRYINDLAK